MSKVEAVMFLVFWVGGLALSAVMFYAVFRGITSP